MPEKDFTVTHSKARAPITVQGRSLKEALKREGLNPSLWKEVKPTPPRED